jgi:SAM-dependent methyltransferase
MTTTSSISDWEAAYLRFETPEEEITKFVARLEKLGARQWPTSGKVVELFCGRGNGLHALDRMGFQRLEGIDLSARLVSEYRGTATMYVGDCRSLPFETASKDVLIVQGGLHHLPVLPDDLEHTLAESKRVLKPGGKFVAVEPWLTPFLSFVHFVSERKLARAMSRKVEALHTMIVHERDTYENWLSRPREILATFDKYFNQSQKHIGRGKLMYVGAPR